MKKPCPSGKTTFRDRIAAWNFAEAKGMRAYRCNLCGGAWHVTSHDKRRSAA